MTDADIDIDSSTDLVRLSGDIDARATPLLVGAGVAAIAALDAMITAITIEVSTVTFMGS